VPHKSRTIKIRRVSANTLKAISLLLLLSCGALFGSDAWENGTLPLIAIFGFGVAGFLFWVGDKLNSN
jgi:hypothetical protein